MRDEGSGFTCGRRAFLSLALLTCLLVSDHLAAQARVSTLKSDEEVIFFPAIATEDGSASWTAQIHAWIFERGHRIDPKKVDAFKALLKNRFPLRDHDFAHPAQTGTCRIGSHSAAPIAHLVSGSIFNS